VREDLHQRRFDRDAAVLAGEQRGENEGAVTLNPVGASPRLGRNFGDVFVGAFSFSLGGRRQLGVLVGGDAVQ
jgi:hypothetical protein